MHEFLPFMLGGLVVLMVAYYAFLVPRNLRFVVTPENLQIRGDLFFSRTIPRTELLLRDAALLDTPDGGGHLHVKIRTNGVGLPNYQTMILTPSNPRELLTALQNQDASRVEPLAQ